MSSTPKLDAVPTWKTRLGLWFTDHTSARTAQQIEREAYVFWAPATGRFSRWMIVLPVFIAQMCIGSLYSCEWRRIVLRKRGA